MESELLPMSLFFEQLRAHQFPLGVGDYQLFLNALQHGFGVQAEKGIFLKASLLRLCKLLWLKPNQSQPLFEELFEASYAFSAPATKSNPLVDTDSMLIAPPVAPREAAPERPQPAETPRPLDDAPSATALKPSIWVKIRSDSQTGQDLQLDSDLQKPFETLVIPSSARSYPLNLRKTQQILRRLPQYRSAQPTAQIDVDATIRQAIETGGLTTAAYQKAQSQQTQLFFLRDHQGSMIGFHGLGDALQTLLEQTTQPQFKPFYFYNVPRNYLFKNKTRTESVSMDSFWNDLMHPNRAVVVWSDAGAARGHYNRKRVEATEIFIKQIRKRTNRMVWLNPMPQYRWADTSAAAIAQHVPMFEAHETGLKNALVALKRNGFL